MTETRFEFGRNWSDFTKKVTQFQIEIAQKRLIDLLKVENIDGNRILDIGTGSGLHSLGFLKNGARYLKGIDIDILCVETSKKLVEAHLSEFEGLFNFEVGDILKPNFSEKYDVVYSWGVLHHTGNLSLAIENAAQFVDRNGLLVLALYRKTLFCTFWKFEKALYCKSPNWAKKLASILYISAVRVRNNLYSSSKYTKFKNEYHMHRGMEFKNDVSDWLGGYPYESISSTELTKKMADLDFKLIKSNTKKSLGLLGSGCDEFVFERIP